MFLNYICVTRVVPEELSVGLEYRKCHSALHVYVPADAQSAMEDSAILHDIEHDSITLYACRRNYDMAYDYDHYTLDKKRSIA